MKFKDFYWRTGGFVIGSHLVFLISLPLYLYYATPSLGLVISSIILFILCGLSVTAGYHRYYSHKTYSLNKYAEAVLLFFGTLAVSSTVIKWSHDHRNHHMFVDTEKDPYNIKQGFWHAHFLWLLKKPKDFNPKIVPDLLKKRWLVWQDKYYGVWMVAANALSIILLGWLFNDYAGAFVISFLTRMIATHHTMWFVNSWAHTWGNQPYSKEHTAVNNWLLAFFTFGEGYHNFHHTFAGDYRNGIRWYQWDPTKFLIWTLEKMGLASNLKKVNSYVIKKRMLMQDRKLLLDSLVSPEMKAEAIKRYERLAQRLYDFQQSVYAYRELKRQKAEKARLKKAREELKNLKKDIREDYRIWTRYVKLNAL